MPESATRLSPRRRTQNAAPPASARSEYRPELQGLRAVAVLLVAVYHIWFNRVSGGVDVFLLLTGFFITGSLLRMADKEGRVRWTAFLSRLLSRLAPAAGVVLAGTLAIAFFILPLAIWRDVIADVASSALYYANWHFANGAVDYLANDSIASPVQHFWSLSIQGQFYLLWPALIAAAILLTRRTRLTLPRAVFTGSAAVFTLSLTYSIYITSHNQPWAYFDTGARLWEFAAGAMLAVALPHLNLPKRLRITLGWTGLTALITCGALLDVSTLFPGYIALWPVAAAMLIIVAGGQPTGHGVDRVLAWGPLARIGDLAYPLYLWHWPIFIGYLAFFDIESAGFLDGLWILAMSIACAAATKWLVEDRTVNFTRVRASRRWRLAVSAAFLAPALALTTAWNVSLDAHAQELEALESTPGNFPGAQVLVDSDAADSLADLPMSPDPIEAYDDIPEIYEDECDARLANVEAKLAECRYGDESADFTAVLVGTSRAAQWFPALRDAAESDGWELVNMTKSACHFSTAEPLYDGELYEECMEWRDNAMQALASEQPDVVITSSTWAVAAGETVPPGYVDRWEQLGDLGVEVVGIRDLPRLPYDVPECVGREELAECVSVATRTQEPFDPTAELDEPPDNVSFIDMTDYVCPNRQCKPVIGNVLVWRDDVHITATYAKTLAPMWQERFNAAVGR